MFAPGKCGESVCLRPQGKLSTISSCHPGRGTCIRGPWSGCRVKSPFVVHVGAVTTKFPGHFDTVRGQEKTTRGGTVCCCRPVQCSLAQCQVGAYEKQMLQGFRGLVRLLDSSFCPLWTTESVCVHSNRSVCATCFYCAVSPAPSGVAHSTRKVSGMSPFAARLRLRQAKQ